jgi:small subunit ribosomal protein S6
MVVLTPTLAEDEVPQAVERLKTLISDRGGTEEMLEVQGRRRLAYPIEKHRDGTIVLTRFDMPPQRVQEVEAGLRVDERVLRNLLVRI